MFITLCIYFIPFLQVLQFKAATGEVSSLRATSNLIKKFNTPHGHKNVVFPFWPESSAEFCSFSWHDSPCGSRTPHYIGFTMTFRHTTLGRTPLDEWSAPSRDLYLTTHRRQTSITPAGLEDPIPESERPQTHALGPAATEIGQSAEWLLYNKDYNRLSKTWNIRSVTLSTFKNICTRL
jgi:hypothetical protein